MQVILSSHTLTTSILRLNSIMNSALTAPMRRCSGTASNVRRQARKNSLHVRSFFFNNPATNGKAASATVPKPLEAAVDVAPLESAEAVKLNPNDLNDRQRIVQDSFPNALSVDDFIARIEVALCKYGFTGDNCIACTNLCRDEVTTVLKDKIEAVFGSSFNTNGLGGVLTCGVTGIGAGLSHSPICTDSGRERYVFFSFPHIAIGAGGELGAITRVGRIGASCACGALIKCLGELKSEGVSENCKVPGVHTAEDPEYSILKQRLARRVRYEQLPIESMNLADFTKVAERTITDDLECLIEKAVDVRKADFAVVTGVEIHNWAPELGSGVPSLEFVAPAKVYTCVNGEYNYIDIMDIPSLTPRQIGLLAQKSMGNNTTVDNGISGSGAVTATSTISSIPDAYLASRIGHLNVTSNVQIDIKGAGGTMKMKKSASSS